MESVQREKIMKLYLKQTNTILIEEKRYREIINEINEAISDREILSQEIRDRIKTWKEYEKQKEELIDKIGKVEQEMEEEKKTGESLRKKRKRIEEERKKVEGLIKRAKEAVN